MWEGPKVSGLTYKCRTKWKMLQGIYVYSAIYGEINVSVSGSYMLQYGRGTYASRTCCTELLQCQKSTQYGKHIPQQRRACACYYQTMLGCIYGEASPSYSTVKE
jgi:hypothetical protein